MKVHLLYFFTMWRIHYDKKNSKISKPQSLVILVRWYLLIILLMRASASILGFRHYNTFPALCSFLYPSLLFPSQVFHLLPSASCSVEASLGPRGLREE